MKRFLLRLLLFLPVAAAGYTGLLWLMGDAGAVRNLKRDIDNAGCLCSRLRDIRNYHDVDILFVGSSHCYRTFDTRAYAARGLRCFNLGSSNQTPLQTEVLLHTYIDSLNPKMVVMEVHPDIMRLDGVESAVNLSLNMPVNGRSALMALRVRNMKALNTWLYALYSQRIRHRLERFAADTVDGDSRYIPGGFCERNTTEFVVAEQPPFELTIRRDQRRALRRCLALLRRRGIPCLMVEVQDAEQYRRAELNHPWFEQQMGSLGPYHYQLLPLTDTVHFFNNDHLSAPGVRLYNAHLLDYLARGGWPVKPAPLPPTAGQ